MENVEKKETDVIETVETVDNTEKGITTTLTTPIKSKAKTLKKVTAILNFIAVALSLIMIIFPIFAINAGNLVKSDNSSGGEGIGAALLFIFTLVFYFPPCIVNVVWILALGIVIATAKKPKLGLVIVDVVLKVFASILLTFSAFLWYGTFQFGDKIYGITLALLCVIFIAYSIVLLIFEFKYVSVYKKENPPAPKADKETKTEEVPAE